MSPRQPHLIEDRAIEELEEIAETYADIRDRRIALNAEEADLKQQTMALMKKHKRTHYARDGIEITLELGEDTIKVKVKKVKEDEGETDDGEDT